MTEDYAHSDETVFGLELEGLLGVVNQGESGTLATTKLSSESKDDDLFLGCLVHGREFIPKFIFGKVGTGRVDNVNNHLLSLEQTVREELPGTNRN
jgi:hypothetical protein